MSIIIVKFAGEKDGEFLNMIHISDIFAYKHVPISDSCGIQELESVKRILSISGLFVLKNVYLVDCGKKRVIQLSNSMDSFLSDFFRYSLENESTWDHVIHHTYGIDKLVENYLLDNGCTVGKQTTSFHRFISFDSFLDTGSKKISLHHDLVPFTFEILDDAPCYLYTIDCLSRFHQSVYTNSEDCVCSPDNAVSHIRPNNTSVSLSINEKAILVYSAKGYKVEQIAGYMCKSMDTIKSCKRIMFKKLGVNNLPEAIQYAFSHGLL